MQLFAIAANSIEAYGMDKMKVGDYFDVNLRHSRPSEEQIEMNRIRNRFTRAAKSIGIKIKTRRISKTTVRVWRIRNAK